MVRAPLDTGIKEDFAETVVIRAAKGAVTKFVTLCDDTRRRIEPLLMDFDGGM
jgi:hypothetical protein